jgi:hypothetical protein
VVLSAVNLFSFVQQIIELSTINFIEGDIKLKVWVALQEIANIICS